MTMSQALYQNINLLMTLADDIQVKPKYFS